MPKAAKTFTKKISQRVRVDERLPSSQRGYDSTWARCRMLAIDRDQGMCVECLKFGQYKSFDIVDHIVPVRVDPSQRLNLNNLQCLCNSHHAIKTHEDYKKYGESYGR